VGQFVVTSTGTGTTPITSALKEENLDNESVECWQIRFTKEIYDDYEQYFQRLQNYRRPIWACSITGNKGLTFEQALLSERRAREHSLRLPRVLQRQLLERIQFSTVTRIDALTDQLHAALADRYFCGEELLFNRGEGEQV
jgi:ferredoxin-NADP reductase